MTLNVLKQTLYDRVSSYWGGGTVVWGAVGKVKPRDPLIVLRMGTVQRATFAAEIVGDGIVFRAYPSEVTLQVDLFTNGRLTVTPQDATQTRENTAANDLNDFANFIDSYASTWWAARNDINVNILNGVQDLSEFVFDSQWQYRAMAEFTINFTQWGAEANGVLSEDSIIFDEDGNPIGVNRPNWNQSSSGGGTRELADEEIGYFESADIEYEKPDKEGNNG